MNLPHTCSEDTTEGGLITGALTVMRLLVKGLLTSDCNLLDVHNPSTLPVLRTSSGQPSVKIVTLKQGWDWCVESKCFFQGLSHLRGKAHFNSSAWLSTTTPDIFIPQTHTLILSHISDQYYCRKYYFEVLRYFNLHAVDVRYMVLLPILSSSQVVRYNWVHGIPPYTQPRTRVPQTST